MPAAAPPVPRPRSRARSGRKHGLAFIAGGTALGTVETQYFLGNRLHRRISREGFPIAPARRAPWHVDHRLDLAWTTGHDQNTVAKKDGFVHAVSDEEHGLPRRRTQPRQL